MLRSVLASSSCIVGRASVTHCRRPFAATPTPGPANAAPHAAAAAAAGSSTTTSFWQRWTAPRPEHAPNSAAWFAEKVLQCGVFGAAGTSSMYLVRATLRNTSVFWNDLLLPRCPSHSDTITPQIRPVLPLVGFSCTLTCLFI
jgi:hypothetical protein